MAKKLNEQSSEVIEKSFLVDDEIDSSEKVVVAREIPKYERITFLNGRDPGVTLDFHYASKTHPLKRYTLMHGQNYELPVEVINHLEGQNPNDPYACHRRMYGRRERSDGSSETFANAYVPLFQCRPVRKTA